MGRNPSEKFNEKCFAGSGASMHMCKNKSLFTDFDETHCQDVRKGNGESADVPGKEKIIAHANVRAKKMWLL